MLVDAKHRQLVIHSDEYTHVIFVHWFSVDQTRISQDADEYKKNKTNNNRKKKQGKLK